MEKTEKKCWKCGRILIRKSRIGLCPKCVDQIEKGAAGIVGVGGIVVVVVKRGGKEVIKHLLKL